MAVEAARIVGGRFALEERLGEGGFSVVWKATDQATGERVAVKILKPTLKRPADALRRFTQEIEIVARLEHRAIARAIAWETDASEAYLVMELAPGVSLEELIVKRRDHFAIAEARAVFRELCGAVQCAHAAQIVHRDLKPRNIIVRGFAPDAPELEVKVLDFGLAKILGEDDGQGTTKGRRMGSPLYMTPEQITGGEIDARTDVFALGTILFELLTLSCPWLRDERDRPLAWMSSAGVPKETNDGLRILHRIARGARPEARSVRPALPEKIDVLFARALATSPSERPASVAELEREVDAALEGLVLDDRPARSIDVRPKIAPAPVTSEIGEPNPDLTAVAPQALDLDAFDGSVARDTPIVQSPRRIAVAPPTAREHRRPRVALPLMFLIGALAASAYLGYAFTDRDPVAIPTSLPEAASLPPAPGVRQLAREEEAPAPPPQPQPQPQPQPIAEAPKKIIAPRTRPAEPPRKPEQPSELSVLAAELRSQPEDAALIARVSRRVTELAARLPDPEQQKSITRRATSAAMIFDAKALEQCIAELERAAAR